MKSVKEAALDMARQLSDESTWDEVMYKIYVLQKIEQGLKAADEGRTIAHEDVFAEFANDRDPLD